MKFDINAADTFERGCQNTLHEWEDDFGQQMAVTKWIDEDRNIWCYVEHDMTGDFAAAMYADHYEEQFGNAA